LDPDYGRKYRELYTRHWWWRAREEVIVEALRRRLRPAAGRRILDVGCGDGLIFERLSEFGEVEGIEPAGELVDPRGPHRERIRVAPFDSAFQPGRRYALILMLDVLEHLDAPEEALRHALDLLEPGGLVLITVPAYRLLWTNHDRLNQHRTRYTKASFRRVAGAAGLQILELRYFFFWMFPVKLGVRLKESLFPSAPGIPGVPPRWLNRWLYLFSRAEERVLRALPIPFGSSLLAVGAKAEREDGPRR
jgi:SAM-dependent methyltransferase